jgi:putative hemolysin
MGVIEANEAEMIANIFEWGDKEAQDIMTHRKNVTALNGELSLSACIEQMLCGTHTRYPVYDGDIDNVIGVLHLKEAVIGLEQKGYGDWKVKDIPDLLQTPYFIPETRNIDMLFQDMQSKKIHMAVVIDEYGQTAGLISMEDILEEIVGNILDEYDEEKDNIVKTGENTYLIDGMTTLEELEDALDISFEEEDYDTINGYLISELGHIPAEDEKAKITIANYEYEICKVENKMISQVALTILPQEEAAQEEER